MSTAAALSLIFPIPISVLGQSAFIDPDGSILETEHSGAIIDTSIDEHPIVNSPSAVPLEIDPDTDPNPPNTQPATLVRPGDFD